MPDIPVNFETYLFLTSRHLLTQTSDSVYCFVLLRHNESGAAAIFQCVMVAEKTLLSAPRAPFGGVQCDENCIPDEISFLLQCITDWAKQLKIIKIEIKSPPGHYKMNDLISNCYDLNNFKKTLKIANHHIPVTPQIFERIIKNSEKRRLKKCRLAGFEGEIWPNANAEIVYDFLKFCRIQKGYNLSVDQFRLTELIGEFPNEVIVFKVTDCNKIIALAVTMRVNQQTLYNFLSASLPAYSTYSPSVLLTDTIYKFCQNENISVLDLGTSLDHQGNEKAGLIQFKENMGGLRSRKITFSKTLATDTKN